MTVSPFYVIRDRQLAADARFEADLRASMRSTLDLHILSRSIATTLASDAAGRGLIARLDVDAAGGTGVDTARGAAHPLPAAPRATHLAEAAA